MAPARHRETAWTNPSVIELAGGDDPIAAITALSRQRALEAMDSGWNGPPFDPMELASILGIEVIANSEVRDARTVPMGRNKVRIEFNPDRPRGRLRYSVAHEIAHTLFPDCAAQIRNRAHHSELSGDAWQLEALCNIAAAEFLMPVGAFAGAFARELTIHDVLELQRRFDVSTEALMIRLAETSDRPLAAFCVSPRDTKHSRSYALDYTVTSRSWEQVAPPLLRLPKDSVVSDCTAIGYSARGVEAWWKGGEEARVEAVGIPAYPGGKAPRVVGFLTPTSDDQPSSPCITYVFGSATDPRTDGRPRILVQVVNDKTPNWGGGGFASALRTAWPTVQEDFRDWAQHSRAAFHLGGVRVVQADPTLSVASIIAQHGYGASASPRIRYASLREGLRTVASLAVSQGATVHMPRIGAGQAGGDWTVVRDIIVEMLCTEGIEVTVYDLPGTVRRVELQTSLLEAADERVAAAKAKWR